MAEISFYHVTQTPTVKALPRLLEKIMDTGKRAFVKTSDPERIQVLSDGLWTYTPLGFLAHGTPGASNPARQPIWVDVGDTNINGASFLVLMDGASLPSDYDAYERIITIFDGMDTESVAQARTLWSQFKEYGWTTTYWCQNTQGAWEKA